MKWWQERIKDREELKHMEEEEKQLLKEYPEENINFWDLWLDDEDKKIDQELDQYLTDQERLELAQEKKEERKTIIVAFSIMLGVFACLFIGLSIFSYVTMSPLKKETIPLMRDYYKNKYQKDVKISDINYLCHEKDCSKIIVAKTSDNHYIMSIDNAFFGDSYDDSIKKEYANYFANYFKSSDIISFEPLLSYQDYYLDYNYYYPYIDVLPDGMNLTNLLSSHHLTVQDIIFYQGEIDMQVIKDYLKMFSSDSKLYFVKQASGIPISLTIATKDKVEVLAITGTIKVDQDITYYELDSQKNNIKDLTIKSVLKNDINYLGDYYFENAYNIQVLKGYHNDDEAEKSQYYFLKIGNNLIPNFERLNVRFFSGSGNRNNYREMEYEDYPCLVLGHTGGNTYLIGVDDLGFGIIKENNPWCKRFNLC